MATILSTKTSGVGGLTVTGDASGVLQLASADGTTAVTIDASQKVGIGTSSPAVILHTLKTSAGAATVGAFIQNSDNTVGTEVRLGFAANTNVVSDNRYGWIGYVNTGGTNGGALTFATTPGGTPATEAMRIDPSGNLLFNSGYGSVATAYGCRAWVNFNGTGTVAIRASGNVTSITDNGVGNYTVNFTTAMPDVNYSVSACSYYTAGAFGGSCAIGANAVGSVQVGQFNGSITLQDPIMMSVQIFR